VEPCFVMRRVLFRGHSVGGSFAGTSKSSMHAPLPCKVPHFFSKKPHDTTSTPAFFVCELWTFLQQICAHIVCRGSFHRSYLKNTKFPNYRKKLAE
jgi:hypothetical protein